jgi:hypothetical protein
VDSVGAKLPVDSLNIRMLMGLPTPEFLKIIESDGPKTDVDTIAKMEPGVRAKYMEAAKNRPLRVEIDTVNIKTVKDLDKLESPIAYINSLNLIKLVYFESSPDATNEAISYCDALNKEIKFMFSHEFKHFLDSQLDITGLSLRQLGAFALQMEITARWNEIMDRRAAFVQTGKISEAFPRELRYLNSKLKDKLDFDSLFVSTNPKGKNPLEHHTVRFMNVENKEYLKWLFNNRGKINPDSIGNEEANIIFTTALRNANREYLQYFDNGQINGMMWELVTRQNAELVKRYRNATKAKALGDSLTYTAPTFTGLVYALYPIDIESLSKDVQFTYSGMLQTLFQRQSFQKTLNDTEKKYERALGNIKTMQQSLYGDGPAEAQKFDISDNRNIRFSFSEDDIAKLNKVLGMER